MEMKKKKKKIASSIFNAEHGWSKEIFGGGEHGQTSHREILGTLP